MRRRLRGLLLGLVCAGALVLGQGGGEAAGLPRAHIRWTVVDGSECPTQRTTVCISLPPGDSKVAHIRVDPLMADVVSPRLRLQSPNGTRIMRTDPTPMPDPLTVGGPSFETAITIDVPPGFRPRRASGRLYVADKGSVLVPPLNIRVEIKHPTPVELALTPVVVPTNHIRLVAGRFNIREFTIVTGTNLTWTNKDVKIHVVRGLLCDSSLPYDPKSACQPDPAAPAAYTSGRCNVQSPDQLGLPPELRQPIPCIDSGRLYPERSFSVRLVRTDPRQLLRYFIDDASGVAAGMTGYVTVK